MLATISSIEAEVSLTLLACICVFFTMFCTLMLISCMVLVTSSMAEEARVPTLAESSEAPATWLEPAATWPALRVPAAPGCAGHRSFGQKRRQGIALERGATSKERSPPAIASKTVGRFLQVSDHSVKGARQVAKLVFASDVHLVLQVAGAADGLGDDDEFIERAGDGAAKAGNTQQCDEPGDDQDDGGDGRIASVAPA